MPAQPERVGAHLACVLQLNQWASIAVRVAGQLESVGSLEAADSSGEADVMAGVAAMA